MKISIYALKEKGLSYKDIRWVGQTNNVKRRMYEHKRIRKSDNNKNKTKWLKSINFNFDVLILEECNQKNCDKREAFWIKKLKKKGFKLLNIMLGGKTTRGFKIPQSTRDKLSKALKGHKVSDKTRENQRLAHLGKKTSKKTRLKQSLALKGKIPKNLSLLHELNKNMTDKQLAHVKKMHEGNKGRRKSKETLAKLSLSLMGRKVSKLTREKISDSLKKLSKENVYDILEQYYLNKHKVIHLAKLYNVNRITIRKVIQNRYF